MVSAIFDLDAHGVSTVGTLPEGCRCRAVPWTKLSDVGPLAVAAVGITLVSLADTIATSSSFGARRGEEVDPNQEMIGIGAANLVAGLLQGFAVSTSGSRTAVVEQAGAKSQLASVVGAGVVVALLLFFNSLLADLPQSALAAVLIAAALSLLDLDALVRYFRVRPSALVLSVMASLGVIVFGVLPGIVIAIGLAVLMFFRRGWQPHGAVLGGWRGWRGGTTSTGYPEAHEIPGSWSTDGRHHCSSPTPRRSGPRSATLVAERHREWVVLQCEAMTDVDVSAAQMLEQLDRELNAAGIHMAFVEMRTRLQDLVRRYGLFETLDRDRFYPTLEAAIADVREA